MPVSGLMLCDDLMFFSRVAETARAAGLAVKQVRTPKDLLELAKSESPGGVLLDLQSEGLDLPEVLAELRGNGSPRPRVVAFGSHVDAERLRQARDAGCDLVVPRSKFAATLEASLQGWLSPV